MRAIKLTTLILILLVSCAPLAQKATDTQIPTSTNTPIPAATSTPTLIPTPTQVGGGSGKLLFSYSEEGYKDDFPEVSGRYNLFLSNFDGSLTVPITKRNSNTVEIEDFSPDGSKALISFFEYTRRKDSNAELYLYNLDTLDEEPILLVKGFSKNTYPPAAMWINNSEIVYIGNGDEGYGFYVIDTQTLEARKLAPYTENPEKILGVNADRVYWETREKTSRGGDIKVLWWTSLDGTEQGKLEANGVQVGYFSGLAISPDGQMIAWRPMHYEVEPECDTKEKAEKLHEDGKFYSTCYKLHFAYLSDMDNEMRIPIEPKDGKIPDNFEHRPFLFLFKWAGNTSVLYMLNPGYRAPESMYKIDFNQTDPGIEWVENFPSIQNSYGAYYPTLRSFSPDGKLLFARKVIQDTDQELVLIDMDNMYFNKDVFSGLNIDEIYHAQFLP